MTDTIGPVSLQRVGGFSEDGRHFDLRGDQADENTIVELRELLQNAENGSAIHRIPGGASIGEDLTVSEIFTQYCGFDDESIPDGYYLLRTPLVRGEDGPVFYFFEFEVYYLGQLGDLVYGQLVTALATKTNDWGK